jgi:SAM-dependent methyltransferase
VPRIDWDAYLATYHAERPGITEAAFEHARNPEVGSAYDWLAAALPRRNGHVLDVACGNAAMQPRLGDHDSYLGVDFSGAELDDARRRGRGPVLRGDTRALPVPDGSMDTVVSSMGLMLVRPLGAVVAEIARVLSPGGTLAVLLPALWPVRVSDLPPLTVLTWSLRGPGSMPQQIGPRYLGRELGEVGLDMVEFHRRRFPFPLRSADDARLVLQALYTPGRTPRQLEAAQSRLSRLAGPRATLPVPLARVVARRTPAAMDGQPRSRKASSMPRWKVG